MLDNRIESLVFKMILPEVQNPVATVIYGGNAVHIYLSSERTSWVVLRKLQHLFRNLKRLKGHLPNLIRYGTNGPVTVNLY